MSMHLGSSDVPLPLSLDFDVGLSAGAVQDAVTRIGQSIQCAHPELTRIFVEAQRTRAHRSGLRSAAG